MFNPYQQRKRVASKSCVCFKEASLECGECQESRLGSWNGSTVGSHPDMTIKAMIEMFNLVTSQWMKTDRKSEGLEQGG